MNMNSFLIHSLPLGLNRTVSALYMEFLVVERSPLDHMKNFQLVVWDQGKVVAEEGEYGSKCVFVVAPPVPLWYMLLSLLKVRIIHPFPRLLFNRETIILLSFDTENIILPSLKTRPFRGYIPCIYIQDYLNHVQKVHVHTYYKAQSTLCHQHICTQESVCRLWLRLLMTINGQLYLTLKVTKQDRSYHCNAMHHIFLACITSRKPTRGDWLFRCRRRHRFMFVIFVTV